MPRKSAKVESERAKINLPDSSSSSGKRKYTKKAQSAVKKANFLVCLILLVASLAVGVGAFFVVSRNDCFELVGAQEITVEMTLSQDETTISGKFVDTDKVKIIEFGKDISNSVKIETDMKVEDDGSYSVSEEGTYYIKYSVDSLKYGKIFTIEKIRLISFVEPSVSDEIILDATTSNLNEEAQG